MFRSIRWRLVTSYTLLTLLTVALVGMLALTLVRRYMTQQEVEYLTDNAEAVAQQAAPLLSALAVRSEEDADTLALMPQPVLAQLVDTSAFLGNVRVRILDADGRVLADSGMPSEPRQLAWFMPPLTTATLGDHDEEMMPGADAPPPFPGFFVALPSQLDMRGPDVSAVVAHLRNMNADLQDPYFASETLPALDETNFVIVRTAPSQWGSRFVFDMAHEFGTNRYQWRWRDELPYASVQERLFSTTIGPLVIEGSIIEDSNIEDNHAITNGQDVDASARNATAHAVISSTEVISEQSVRVEKVIGPRMGEGPTTAPYIADATLTIDDTATENAPPTADIYDVPRSPQIVSVPIGESETPMGYVELSNGPDFGTNALAAIQRAFLIAAGAVSLLSAAVGLLVGQGLTAPLLGLMAATNRMSSGDFTTRAPIRSRDETGVLAHQFNQMAIQLEMSFAELAAERDTLRRFIADASHELRTPITALKTFNELLQGPATADPSAQTEFLQESQRQIDRLEWITANLLDLSRLDAGLVEMEVCETPMDELLSTATAPFRTLAQKRAITLTVEQPNQALTLRCDKARMELVLTNLLDNALKLTPDGGKVEIGARQTEGQVQIWVNDSGAGIAADDLPHIFDRFYRRTHTDSDDGEAGHGTGSGLGLAIAQAIVQAHGGTIRAKSTAGEGSQFTVTLSLGAASIND